jgi:DMSO/TMAO reductase YedYZ heme-binding membrane subunit
VKDPRFAKFVVLVNGLVPLALLAWDYFTRRLGANPKQYVLHTTGMLAIIFLVLSLAVTPVRKVTGRNWFSHFRRMLGLFAFFYALLHLAAFTTWDLQLDFGRLASETARRPFILYGMVAFVLMLPLAVTSTNAMIKRLGAARWKALHKAAYVAAVAAVLHFYALVKADIRLPVAFAIALAVLFAYRLWDTYKPKKTPPPAKPKPKAPPTTAAPAT